KYMYINESGRNDITALKFAASAHEIGFYAQTADKLTHRDTDNWMTLWLNVDENYNSGWKGYDFRVIKGDQLQRYNQGAWQTISQVQFEQSENALLIKIPLAFLALPNKDYIVEFKWSDNMQKD